jgi:hypothetical protein
LVLKNMRPGFQSYKSYVKFPLSRHACAK